MGTLCHRKEEIKISAAMLCRALHDRMAEIIGGSQISLGKTMVNKILVE